MAESLFSCFAYSRGIPAFAQAARVASSQTLACTSPMWALPSSMPGAYVALFKKIEELGGISTCADALAGYTLAPREVQPIQTYLQENLGRNEALVRQIGCVIGTHAGPGAFGLAFLDEGFTF